MMTQFILTVFQEDMKVGIGAIQLIGEILRDSPAIFLHNYKTVIEEIVNLTDGLSVT